MEENKDMETKPNNIKPVLAGKAKVNKKESKKNSIIVSDIKDVCSYVLHEIIVPSFKSLVVDSGKNALDMMFSGEIRNSVNKSNRSDGRSHYGSMYYSSRDRERESDRERNYRRYGRSGGIDFDDIYFASYSDADAILSAMDDVLDMYGFVKISDYYDLSDVSCDNPQYCKYGWSSLRGAKPVRVSGGDYTIDFPRPEAK